MVSSIGTLQKNRDMIQQNQIAVLEQVKGVEPSYRAWEARVLPMNYTCKFLIIIPCKASLFNPNEVHILICSFPKSGHFKQLSSVRLPHSSKSIIFA